MPILVITHDDGSSSVAEVNDSSTLTIDTSVQVAHSNMPPQTTTRAFSFEGVKEIRLESDSKAAKIVAAAEPEEEPVEDEPEPEPEPKPAAKKPAAKK